MALIMYLTRVPRCENITAKEVHLIESYLNWQHEKEIGSQYASETFEKWCGRSESELPEKNVINYYKQFFTEKTKYVEGLGEMKGYSLFEQLARLVKENHIFNWFIKNVMNDNADKEYHEVTKDQLEKLLNACDTVKESFKALGKNGYTGEYEYRVDESVAKKTLPFMETVGYFFGPSEYDSWYANMVIKTSDVIRSILSTTDFDKQIIYFKATW